MIKFEIDESLNFRGGNHYCYVDADEPNEVIEALKDAWYSSGIHRHGGELFLSALISNDDNSEIELFCGHCSVDKDEDLYSVFEFPYYEDEKDKWHSLGLFSDNINVGSFEDLLEIFFDYDSPNRVIGSYLYKVSKINDELSDNEQNDFGKNVLADILSFSKTHDKLQQMYEWLRSEDGIKYLESNDYLDPAGTLAAEVIQQNPIENLDEFITKFKKDFGIKIVLPSSLL
jgi:hypothetical protein